MEKNAVLETIHRVLAPYLGASMAAASTRAHCEKLGIGGDGEPLAEEQVEALVTKLGAGLAVFVGREKSAGVVEEIRRAIRSGARP